MRAPIGGASGDMDERGYDLEESMQLMASCGGDKDAAPASGFIFP